GDDTAAPSGSAGMMSSATSGAGGMSGGVVSGTGGGGYEFAQQPDTGVAPPPDVQAPDAGTVTTPDATVAPADAGPIQHHLMAIEYPGRIVEISADGKLLWEHKTPSLAVMFNVLPNGHVFYPHGAPSPGAEEVDKNHTVVWSFTNTAGELLGGE